MSRSVPCLLALLLASTGCSGTSSSTPRSPTAPGASPGASADALPIEAGQIVAGTVAPSDRPCEPDVPGEPPEPCQRFAVAVSTPGILAVRVTSPGPSELTLRVGPVRRWGVTTLSASVSVEAGATYEIAVALHGAAGGDAGQTFQLATLLTPR